MTRARIIFVPGLKPKPPPELYREQLLRVLAAGLQARPPAARWLEAHPESFLLVAWTYLFYGAHRDLDLDLPGIERLLAQPGPSAEDLRELGSWSRRLVRLSHVVGDALPLLGRRLVQPATRLQMHDANRYLKNRDGIGTVVRGVLRETLKIAWQTSDRVLLIGHSLGSVIAYDTLWELSRDSDARRVDLFVTLGSPLATKFVQRSLQGAGASGAERYPRNIRRWANFAAKGDMTALHPRLKPTFGEMLDLGLVESIEDCAHLENYFRGSIGLNAHEAYGYLAQHALGEVIGDWLLGQ